MIGKSVSHFRIVRELGRGGMGVVYAARDVDLDRDVALKFLPAHFTNDESAVQRFLTEARAASALDHENICAIHEVGRAEDGSVFIAMALYGGRTLKELIAEGPLHVDRARDIAAQIATGLAVAHQHGIVHRDIKPANIIVTDRGQVKVLDFGLAKLLANATDLTATGTTVGTVGYMSPEQIRGDSVDARSDVWSLGIVLYEMLAGKLPFSGDHPAALSYAIVHEAPVPVTRHAAVPPGLVRVIERALKKNASERYADTTEMLADLRGGASIASRRSRGVPKRWIAASAVLLAVLIAAIVFWQRSNSDRVRWARDVAIPEIERLTEDRSASSEQPNLWRAYELAAEVEEVLPGDQRLERLRPEFARQLHVRSTPAGAHVRARSYNASDDSWRPMGTTPLQLWFPLGVSRFEVSLDGYVPSTDIVLNSYFVGDTVSVMLHRPEEPPPGMLWVSDWDEVLALPGLEGLDAQRVPGFWVDRCEVSNREYKAFLDAGGYQKPEYWKQPFVNDGKPVRFDDAMSLFVDTTGRPGPASWEAGDFPDGAENHPVAGVSWYEAAAYAEFAGKQLPTIYHWNAVAFTRGSSAIVPAANFAGKGSEPVDSDGAVHRSGALNLAGNVREWCWNETDVGERFILGGGWSDPTYSFNDAYAQRPFDRSNINGFRCIKLAESANTNDRLEQSIVLPKRDFKAEKPVGDDIFAHILQQYGYDRTPLDARIEYERDESDWIRQKISFNAAYPNARVTAYLFLPKDVSPPFQTVIFFPGSGDLYRTNSEELRTEQLDFFVKSGRAFLYPVYNGMFERGGVVPSDQPSDAAAYRDWMISLTRDLSRSIDYLETRDDIDLERLAYYGVSMGGRMGPLMLAVEKRFRAGILYVAGLKIQRSLAEADPFNFAPRVTLPVLMVNARYDFFFPLETAQRPLFELLGTPKADKKWVVYDGGHSVPRNKLIAESLAWLDHYLGPVEAPR